MPVLDVAMAVKMQGGAMVSDDTSAARVTVLNLKVHTLYPRHWNLDPRP